MKRLWGFICLGTAAMLIAGGFGIAAQAQTSAERIDQFSARIEVNKDSTIKVTEKIVYYFGVNSRRGIFRSIPVMYKTDSGNNQSAKISQVAVVDENGTPYKFTLSIKGGDEVIKIGDPNTLVGGVKTYIISYTVDRAIGYFKDFDEIYWNVTGTGWDVPIIASDATVILPASIVATKLQTSCYVGARGSTERCTAPKPGTGEVAMLTFPASRILGPHEGLTVAAGFPKGIVYEPTKSERALNIVRDNLILLLPVAVLAVMFYLWYTKGRDPKGRGTVVAEYDAPDRLTPLEASAVLRQGVRNEDISAEIIYLATRGRIKIIRLEDSGMIFKSPNYQLELLGDEGAVAEPDKKLVSALFSGGSSVRLSDLKNKFYIHLPGIKKEIVNSVVAKEYYPSNPQKVQAAYVGFGIAAIALLWLTSFFGVMGGAAAASLIISGIIIIAFSMIMPKVTQKGAEARERIKGLKLYITVAEEDRIKFHNAPEKSPELFEKLLPYAMIFGAEEAWAKEFESIYTTPPSWYSDPSGRAFNAVIFSHNLSAFHTAAASTLSSAPGGHAGSGGGGFSGGGGGGGGGGSW